MENIIWVALVCAVLALVFAAWKTSVVSKADAGTERMREIAESISDGARAFLFAEYKILVIFVAVLFVLIGLFITWLTAVCFLIGAVFSVCAGYVGMNVATKANVRTAAAAKASGMNKALGIAFSGGPRKCPPRSAAGDAPSLTLGCTVLFPFNTLFAPCRIAESGGTVKSLSHRPSRAVAKRK